MNKIHRNVGEDRGGRDPRRLLRAFVEHVPQRAVCLLQERKAIILQDYQYLSHSSSDILDFSNI